jgi:hypothetical protein
MVFFTCGLRLVIVIEPPAKKVLGQPRRQATCSSGVVGHDHRPHSSISEFTGQPPPAAVA